VNNQAFKDTILTTLTGEAQQNALDFANFLDENGMTVEDGKVLYKGQAICWIHMDGKTELPGPWTIWPSVTGTVPEGFTLSEATIIIAHEHVNICGDCGSSCAPGSRKTVYGKEFDNVCGAILAFTDPGPVELVAVKELLSMIATTL